MANNPSTIAELYAYQPNYNSYGCMLWSVKRNCIQYDGQGRTIFDPSHWEGGSEDLCYRIGMPRSTPNTSENPLLVNLIASSEVYSVPINNYIQTISPTIATATIGLDFDTLQDAIVTTQRYNAIRQPTLLVQHGITPSKQNIVSLNTYDHFGRPLREYIPQAMDITYQQNKYFSIEAQTH